MIRVLITDDEALIRGGFRMILDAEPDIEVVGEASDGGEAVEMTRVLDPDVVLMDVRMEPIDGIEAARRILTGSRARVVMLTTFDRDQYIYEALKAGASGFLLKSLAPQRLVDAVRAVHAGEALLAPAVTRRLIEDVVRRPPPSPTPPPGLTDRELEVLMELARGGSNAEIAASLFLSEATVKTYVTRILDKLGLRDRVQAVVFAYTSGLVRPGDQ